MKMTGENDRPCVDAASHGGNLCQCPIGVGNGLSAPYNENRVEADRYVPFLVLTVLTLLHLSIRANASLSATNSQRRRSPRRRLSTIATTAMVAFVLVNLAAALNGNVAGRATSRASSINLVDQIIGSSAAAMRPIQDETNGSDQRTESREASPANPSDGSADASPTADDADRVVADIRYGFLVDVPLPLDSDAAESLIRTLDRFVDRPTDGGVRPTVVLRLKDRGDGVSGDAAGEARTLGRTELEDALRLTRALTRGQWRSVRWVVWVDTTIDDNAAIILAGGEQWLMSDTARLQKMPDVEDETLLLNFRALAKRRGLIPDALVQALASPTRQLALVTLADGTTRLAAGDELRDLQQSGQVIRSDVWSDDTTPLSLDAVTLRRAGLVSAVVNDRNAVAAHLDLASLKPLSVADDGEAIAARLNINGPISQSRVRRFLANLAGIEDDVNTLLVVIDSTGGDADASTSLAASLVDPPAGVRSTIGVVTAEAIGDAALLALACKPLYMTTDSRLGGDGGDGFSAEDGLDRELIEVIARRTGRSAGLMAGLIERRDVHRFTNRRTGAIAYGTIEDVTADADDPALAADQWIRGEQISLQDGLDATAAQRLGLVESVVESIDEAAVQAGLSSVPTVIRDRPLVRFIERIGSSMAFSFLLVSIGLMALSGEMNAPGLGLPGFVAAICFALFFWTKFLNGTAEWFELIVLALGLIFIAIELFVVPGVGVFGVGGLLLTILGIVLMSQTFIVPENEYQLRVLSRSVWTALGGVGAMIAAFIVIRMYLPSVPFLGGLVMEGVDEQYIDQHERLGDFDHLLHQVGVAATVMRPSGKATIDGQLVQVVSDGSIIERGEPVRVCEVRGTRVVVEPIDPDDGFDPFPSDSLANQSRSIDRTPDSSGPLGVASSSNS